MENTFKEQTSEFNIYYHQKRLEVLQRLFKNFFGTVLDIGCGHSIAGSYLPNVIGVDICSPANASRLVKGDALHIPIKDDSVDCVYAGEVIEHFNEQPLFLNEIRRVLKTSGLLLISTPNITSAYGDHVKMLPYRKFKSLISSNGFRITQVEGIYCRFFSRTGLYKKLPTRFLKKFLMNQRFPHSISYNIMFLCIKVS